MSNAERLVQNEEVEIRVTYESPSMMHKVSFPAFGRQAYLSSCLRQV